MSIKKVGFVGLGAMGLQMAGHLAKAVPTVVFDLNGAAVEESVKNGATAGSLEEIAGADIIFSSLPRSTNVESVAETMMASGNLRQGTIWVDTTSGVPVTSQKISAALEAHGVHFLDCGVAGGPAGAAAGNLTAMVGGSEDKLKAAIPTMENVMGKIVYIGPSGAGHAVKSVNNTLLAAHIVVAYEGLLTLAKLGVPMDNALEAINAASGRSLVTEERIPNHVLSRKFDFGFAMDLMLKDVTICRETIDELDMDFPVLKQVHEQFKKAEAELGAKSEHMELLKMYEAKCGAEIHPSSPKE
jgi:3-hydroxyisobutyrate dehydrogenase